MKRSLCLLLCCAAVAAPALQAYVLDPQEWNTDAQRVGDMQAVATNLRTTIEAFAAQYGDETVITGAAHMQVERMMWTLARLRHHLGAIEERWSSALPPRRRLNDGVTDRLRGTALCLAASSVLLRNAVCLVENIGGTLYEGRFNQQLSRRTTRIVQDLFVDIHRNLASAKRRKAIKKRIQYLNSHAQTIGELIETGDENLEALVATLSTSDELTLIEEEGFWKRLGRDLASRVRAVRTRLGKGTYKAVGGLAKVFFKTLEKVETRKPHIRGALRDRVRSELLAVLEPGDIVLQKAGFIAHDWVFPGYWSHCALWIGKPAQMESLGLFSPEQNAHSYEKAMRHKARLLEGRSIVEALFPGLDCRTLGDYNLRADEIAVIRLKPLPGQSPADHSVTIRDVACRALFHLEQPYDFSFDNHTFHTVVCSELIYQTFPERILWPVVTRLARPTVSPDAVACMAGPTQGFPFEVVYYHARRLSTTGPSTWQRYWRLLEDKGDLPHRDDPRNEAILEAIDALCLQGTASSPQGR